MDTEMFRMVCAKVAEEKDPQKLELLKQRLRLLLREDTPTTRFPHNPKVE
jgi:hypothetical protein